MPSLSGSWTSLTSRTLFTRFTSWAATHTLARWLHIIVSAIFLPYSDSSAHFIFLPGNQPKLDFLAFTYSSFQINKKKMLHKSKISPLTRVVVCLLILRSLSSMLRGVKAASSSRRRLSRWKPDSANMKRKWKKDESGEEEEEEEGECFSVDSLESGKGGGTKFKTNTIKISTVSDS